VLSQLALLAFARSASAAKAIAAAVHYATTSSVESFNNRIWHWCGNKSISLGQRAHENGVNCAHLSHAEQRKYKQSLTKLRKTKSHPEKVLVSDHDMGHRAVQRWQLGVMQGVADARCRSTGGAAARAFEAEVRRYATQQTARLDKADQRRSRVVLKAHAAAREARRITRASGEGESEGEAGEGEEQEPAKEGEALLHMSQQHLEVGSTGALTSKPIDMSQFRASAPPYPFPPPAAAAAAPPPAATPTPTATD
jgi:hypothetical protein